MTFEEPLEDQGEIGDMKKQYANQLSIIKDIFPNWSDIDLLFALTESDGDIDLTTERIVTGMSRTSHGHMQTISKNTADHLSHMTNVSFFQAKYLNSAT